MIAGSSVAADERLRRRVSRIVATVAHELRTPLTCIKGFAETLLQGAMTDPAACARFLTIIHGQAARLIRLVDDLAELSRSEAGSTRVVLVPVRLNALVVEAVTQMRPLAERRGIALVSHVDGSHDVLVDPDRILQVLTNLIDNAIKFTAARGCVRVTTAGGPADAAEADSVAVSVSDTGRGIPADGLPRIFDYFYRAGQSGDARGAGLGLAIAKHLVEAHGGSLRVASRLNAGTTFTFTLPRTPPLRRAADRAVSGMPRPTRQVD